MRVWEKLPSSFCSWQNLAGELANLVGIIYNHQPRSQLLSRATHSPILPWKTKPQDLCPPHSTPKPLCPGSPWQGDWDSTAMRLAWASELREKPGWLQSWPLSLLRLASSAPVMTKPSPGPACVPDSWERLGLGGG